MGEIINCKLKNINFFIEKVKILNLKFKYCKIYSFYLKRVEKNRVERMNGEGKMPNRTVTTSNNKTSATTASKEVIKVLSRYLPSIKAQMVITKFLSVKKIHHASVDSATLTEFVLYMATVRDDFININDIQYQKMLTELIRFANGIEDRETEAGEPLVLNIHDTK